MLPLKIGTYGGRIGKPLKQGYIFLTSGKIKEINKTREMAMNSTQHYSNKLDLDKFFFEARNLNYVIIKITHFPNYYKGSDIDIFCENMVEFTKLILGIGNIYVEQQNFEIIVTIKDTTHTYIDVYISGELDFRFDVYSALPEFKNLSLKKDLFFDILKNKTFFYSAYNGDEYSVFVPSETDDFLLRYIEYLEWYQRRPDKIKHLDYILERLSSDKDKIIFINKLHNYTKLYQSSESKNTLNPSHFKNSLAKLEKRLLRKFGKR